MLAVQRHSRDNLDRRRFLLGGAGLLGVIGAGVAVGGDWRARVFRARARPRRLADGRVVFVARAGAFELNESGRWLWRLCDGRHDGAALVDALVRRTGVDERRAAADVAAFLQQMLRAGLVEVT